MRKVGIIGLGHVGATLAYTLVIEGLVDELVLIDKEEKIAVSEEYDLLDAEVYMTGKTNIVIQDYQALNDASIIVFCAGQISALGDDGDRFKELEITSRIVEEVAPKIKQSGFDGIIITITNPCDVIAAYMQKLTGFPKNKVFGTGTMLDTARMKQAVGRSLAIDSRNVGGYVYGEHGDSQFVAWSTITVGDRPLLTWNTELDLDVLDDNVRAGGWNAFAGKGYTSYGIATCGARLIRMIFNDSKTIVPVSTYSQQFDVYYGQPVVIGRNGVESLIDCPLSKEENDLLASSAQIIKTALTKLPLKK
ncbi:L-lactate dehydrogenase [Enterococcus quebecensis]|uniref:L-lactate dehydrogenase n=1 Tax=Enterococcus quebecensis TaxID=903983 RepID=A0A1E5GXG0_9ENTE|nr:L-lactate dehydrogenase [Enterococcus quebecensis]OEG17000.1 L-lactate dehydrogenase [Enterococcus quebecensis]OJG75369.1 L-lactate dehydrogenase [Enterococcus quebecensis]